MSEERSVFADPADALCWLTECTLATIEHWELHKTRIQGQLNGGDGRLILHLRSSLGTQ